MLHSICQQIWKTQQWPQDLKRSVFILIPKKGDAKECSNYRTIALISQASKVMLKTLQDMVSTIHELWTSRCSSWILKRQRNQRSNCQHPLDHGKTKEFEKNIYFYFIDYVKSFECFGSQQTGKFLKWQVYQTNWLSSWEICVQVKKQQLEWDMEQQTGSKLGKEYIKDVVSPYLFNLYAEYIMWSARLDEASWNQDCWGKYQ